MVSRRSVRETWIEPQKKDWELRRQGLDGIKPIGLASGRNADQNGKT
jgi:hypothetical protein